MPLFEIERYEIHVRKYRVDAEDAPRAIVRLFDGEAEPVSEPEYLEIAEERGFWVDDHPTLAEQLRALGIPVDGPFIPSIRRVLTVEIGKPAPELT